MDERVFLATQIADETRHTFFFDRCFEEVLGHQGGVRSALADFGPATREGHRHIFYSELPEAIDRWRLDPEDPVALVEAVVTYHLIIEGYLALEASRVRSAQRLLRQIVRRWRGGQPSG